MSNPDLGYDSWNAAMNKMKYLGLMCLNSLIHIPQSIVDLARKEQYERIYVERLAKPSVISYKIHSEMKKALDNIVAGIEVKRESEHRNGYTMLECAFMVSQSDVGKLLTNQKKEFSNYKWYEFVL